MTVIYSPHFSAYSQNKSTTPSSQTRYTTGSIALAVLDAFDIPYIGSAGGILEGYDIHNQDAISMLRLSLAQELPGDFYEVYANEYGIAEFVSIGKDLQNAADMIVRYTVESGRREMRTDLVIVRGYDPPAERVIRDAFDGMKNKSIIDYSACSADTCQTRMMARHASIIYDDPYLDQSYHDDVVNAYELQAFETIIGYIIHLNVPDSAQYPGVRVSFSGTCKEPLSLGTGADVRGFSSTTVRATVVSNDGCDYSEEDVQGYVKDLGTFTYTDVHGEDKSDFQSVADFLFIGQKVVSIQDFRSLGGNIIIRVEPKKQTYSLEYGKHWVYEVDSEDNVKIVLIYIPTVIAGFGEGTKLQDLYNSNDVEVRTYDPATGADKRDNNGDIITLPNYLVEGIGDGLGYHVSSMCAFVERRKPSVDVFDPNGTAINIANSIDIEYKPVVVVDEPPPVAFASRTSISGLGTSGIIDQSLDLVDNDPATLQDFTQTDSQKLQDYTNGPVLDVTLPFATDSQCLSIASKLLELQNEAIDTKTYICGPSSSPKLGYLYNGQVINSISESFSDSGSYTISVTTGTKTVNVGSWGDSRWVKRTEDITRDGTITQVKGDGTSYMVKVAGLGTYEAVSFVTQELYVGDKVQVRISNYPVEV